VVCIAVDVARAQVTGQFGRSGIPNLPHLAGFPELDTCQLRSKIN
jgi:hypothetical protein